MKERMGIRLMESSRVGGERRVLEESLQIVSETVRGRNGESTKQGRGQDFFQTSTIINFCRIPPLTLSLFFHIHTQICGYYW